MAVRKKLKELYKEIPIIDRDELLERINLLPDLRDKALVCFLYLSGCRIEEVVKFYQETNLNRKIRKKPKPITERKLIGLPIQKKQIELFADKIIIRGVRCLKRNTFIKRSIPIIFKDIEKPFIKILLQYLVILPQDNFIFNLTRNRAYQILKDIDLYPHYLRHLRLTHLVVDYNFNTEHLKQFCGWKDSKTADSYIHLSVEDLLKKMGG